MDVRSGRVRLIGAWFLRGCTASRVRRSLTWVGGVVAAAVVAANAFVLVRGAPSEPRMESPNRAFSPVPSRVGSTAPLASPRIEPDYDAIVVLGAGVHADGTPSLVLADRLDTAVELWHQGISKRILVSGDHGASDYDELGPSRRYLVNAGIPDSAIFLDHAGFDTYSTFWRARRVFGAATVAVVTQRFHLRRALFYARSLGLRADGRAADRHNYPALIKYELRECLSRTAAPLYVGLDRTPRQPGEALVNLFGDGHVTHDPHP